MKPFPRLTKPLAVLLVAAIVGLLLLLDWELERTCAEWCRVHPLGPCCESGR